MLKGIDVSHYNGTPDFAKAKAAGVAFVYVKATEGTSYTDPMFQPNMYNAMKAGLPVGAYHFGRPSNDPHAEADHFIKTISVFRYNLLPVLDLEVDEGKDGKFLYNWTRSFVNRVKEKTGHQVMFYTGLWFLQQYPALKQLNDLPLWVAVYGRSSVPATGWKDWTVWQYTDQEHVPGVGRCDADWVKDLKQIMIGGEMQVAQTQNGQILLKRGSTGDLVKKLQERLNIQADGVFGPMTEESVKEWQRLHGLVATGIVDSKTWTALFPPPPPMYRVTVDGKPVLDSVDPTKVSAAVQDAVSKHAKEIIVKPR